MLDDNGGVRDGKNYWQCEDEAYKRRGWINSTDKVGLVEGAGRLETEGRRKGLEME